MALVGHSWEFEGTVSGLFSYGDILYNNTWISVASRLSKN